MTLGNDTPALDAFAPDTAVAVTNEPLTGLLAPLRDTKATLEATDADIWLVDALRVSSEIVCVYDSDILTDDACVPVADAALELDNETGDALDL